MARLAPTLIVASQARWGWRAWEFAVALLLMDLCPQTMRAVSVYGLLDNVARVALGGPIGALVNHDV